MIFPKAMVVALCIFCSGCSKRIPQEWMAAPADYPEELLYDPSDRRYVGVPELELRSERNGFIPEDKVDPITTFDSAFRYAGTTLRGRASDDLIKSQLPLLIDYENGVWLVSGSLPRLKSSGSVFLGGMIEMAFLAKTGEVLYIVLLL